MKHYRNLMHKFYVSREDADWEYTMSEVRPKAMRVGISYEENEDGYASQCTGMLPRAIQKFRKGMRQL